MVLLAVVSTTVYSFLPAYEACGVRSGLTAALLELLNLYRHGPSGVVF